jgi:hypothetical protein
MCDDPYLYDDYSGDVDYWYEEHARVQSELDEALEKIKDLEAIAGGIRELRNRATWCGVGRGQNPIYDALTDAASIADGEWCPKCWRASVTHNEDGSCYLPVISPPRYVLPKGADQWAPNDR